ncbi:MAG: transposase [Paludibacteraceae bacterium]|nr:transposase [Paludibacteraceae bacterium]
MKEEKFICEGMDIPKDPFLDEFESVNELYYHDLPHWHQDKKLQFVTFRLADSLPQSKLEDFIQQKKDFLRFHPQPWDDETAILYYKKYGSNLEKWLDAGMGSCALKEPEIREIVNNAFYFFNEKKYILHSFVIMPNHVHVLVELLGENKINEILHSWKSFTANQINKKTGRSDKFWMRESFDRIIRDESHYKKVVSYITNNPRNLDANSYTLMMAKKKV